MAAGRQEIGHGRDFAIRWRNFRGFADSGWIRLLPLTILIGANGSGKSSLLAPLLLLKQSLLSRTGTNALSPRGEFIDCGEFRDFVRNHDVRTRTTFEVIWHSHVAQDELPQVGVLAPGAALLRFEQGDAVEDVRLADYRVFDAYGRRMLGRRRLKSGKYSLQLVDPPDELRRPQSTLTSQQRQNARRQRKAMRDAEPVDFLFTSREVRQPGGSSARQPTDAGFQSAIDDDEVRLYCAITDHVYWALDDLLGDGLDYVGPLREAPKRVYELSGERPQDVGTRGQFAPEIAYRWRDDPERLEQLTHWLRHFGFASRIHFEPVGSGGFSITVQVEGTEAPATLVDTGLGLSQVLPLIVQLLRSPGQCWLVTEQPEIHLNPRLQAALADLFVFGARSGTGLIVETHSEHLLIRLRRLVAEGEIDSADVALYYVEQQDGESVVRRVPIESTGRIEPGAWPQGFFEDSLREALALAQAQADAEARPSSLGS